MRIAAATTLIDYIHGPERIVPVALRRFAAEGPAVRKAFGEVFRNSRLAPSTLPRLLDGLSQEDPEICLNCAAAIDRMGPDAAPALSAMLALIRRELERPRPARRDDTTDILGTAADAIGQIRPEGDAPAEAVDLLVRILEQAVASLDADAHRAGPKSIEGASLDALAAKTRLDRRIQGSIWSLGMMGPGASKALPRLLALYEPPPAGVAEPRGLLAEALAEIARTTPDRSRVLGRLVGSWSTASPHDRAPLARALRRLDPDADRLVPDLKHQSNGVSLPPFRRHRFARSRREYTHF
ncbi:hypothetical protein [Singulisphaera sp. PoT]|uniref:hypothetical protein n=1 Tax=Singulisphaera sp. PoT TaxID=3411797 RepID=UPI003BF520D9